MKRGKESWRTDTLIRRALSVRTEEARWSSIRELHKRSTRAVFVRAQKLCYSDRVDERILGADIIGQLRSYPIEASKILRSMLNRTETPKVLSSALYSLGHSQATNDHSDIEIIAAFRNHDNPDVRHAVVFALLGHNHDTAIETLIHLSKDEDDDTRDWAVFGLGAQIDTNTKEIRSALWKRVDDRHNDTRWEAINGLAIRQDPEIRNVLIQELSVDNPEACWFQIAGEARDPVYLPILDRHLKAAAGQCDVNEEWLECLRWAIEIIRQTGTNP